MSSASSLALDPMKNQVNDDFTPGRSVLRRFGTYLHLYIIAGVALPVVIYLVVMQSLGWRMPTMGTNGLFTYVAGSSNQVMLYASPNTKTFLTSIGGNYDVLLAPWRDYFADRKLRFKEITDPEQLKRLDDGVLILPSAVALSSEEKAEILAFRTRGGGVLSTWATGTRTAKGDWSGWGFVEQLGAKVVGELPADSDANHLIINGESPVAHTLPAGQRMFMSRMSESLLRLQGEAVAAKFLNWARTPTDDRREEGAIVYSETLSSSGRAVVFAFAETAWASHPVMAYTLFDDVLAWLRREPMTIRAAWPNGKLAASVIEMDTEEGFGNATNLASMMEAIDYPTTFFALTSVGKKFPDVLTQLERKHEIGFHGDIHIGFKDQTVAAQEQRIKNMFAEMRSVLPNTSAVLGFRAPIEGYDATTEKLLQHYGIRYHVADPNRSEARLPKMAQLDGVDPEEDIVVLPRTQRDDINLYWEKLPVDQLSKALSNDAALVLENGGLSLLSVHSQNLGTDSALYKALPAHLVYLKQNRNVFWSASAGQVADWWRQRERFRVASRFSGKRLEFDVSVVGKSPVRGGTVLVMLPQKGVTAKVHSTKTTGMKPNVVRLDAYRAAIIFDALPPGNYSYQVTFEP
jgi:peptidoglycan/xylan/chitin deacetylase (PgdA/CDA1 family)